MPALSFCVRAFWKKSWSWVNMLWNANCLHDNSPVSSFRLSSAGCMQRQPKPSVPWNQPADWSQLLKKIKKIYLSSPSSVLSRNGLSPPSVPPHNRTTLTHVYPYVCVCIKSSTVLWNPFDRSLARVQTAPPLRFAYCWQRCCVHVSALLQSYGVLVGAEACGVCAV